MNPYWQSLAAPWRQRANARSWFGLIALAMTLLLLGLVILLIGEFSHKAVVVSALVLIVMSTEGAWMLHIAATVQLNQPACVLLVPRYLQVQRRALLALWLAMAALQMAAFVAARALGLTVLADSPALWMIACAGSLFFWALAIRWPFVVAAAFISTPVWLQPFAQRLIDLPPTGWADLVSSANGWAVPMLVAMAWGLSRSALRPGNAAHREQAASNAKILAALQDISPADAYRLSARASKGILLLQVPFHRYARWLLAKPGTGPHHALARAELGLGARTHWVMQVVNVCAIAAVVGLGACGYARMVGNPWEVLFSPATLLLLVAVTLAPLAQWRIALSLSVKEQALIVLLPGMPQGVALNQALALRHFRHLFVAWVAMTLVLLCAPWPLFLGSEAQLLSILALPLLPLVIQDWSRLATLTPLQWVTLIFKGVVWMPGALVVLYLLQVPMAGLAALSVLVCGATAMRRWKRLKNFSSAFPVGQRVPMSSRG